MGLALSRELASQGWKVALADIQPNAELSKELGDAAEFFKTDVADYDSQAKTFQAVFDKWGRIDALCANAGIVDRSSIYIFEHKGSDKCVVIYIEMDRCDVLILVSGSRQSLTC
jgi:NAD(P)-dependent dehydrogenase (short-subunit alcohol dehydrogenase family)